MLAKTPIRTRLITASALVVALGLGVSACSGGESSTGASESSSPSASPSPSQSGYPVEFKSTLRSVQSRVNDVGTSGNQTYGVNVLEGSTEINDVYVKVRMLGTVDYTDKSGTIGGFLELIWQDGTVLGFRQNGTATFDKSSKETEFDATLETVNGSGKAVGTTGTGTLTGTRPGSLGASVKIEVALDLVNAPELITGDASSRGVPTPSKSYSATIAP
ncbi:MAG: hypothetical protein WC054_09475 [Candidatus Nanopelagicales bacterium]